MKTLVMGGTRFIGKYLIKKLQSRKHEITLFTRGLNPVPDKLEHIQGDRNIEESLEKLRGRKFDLIIDTSGRKLEDTQKVISFTGKPLYRLLYVSSAGVYSNSLQWPIDEEYEIDQKSRHIGKAETEAWLLKEQIPFTSFRPTYIYGPDNYNPIEKWFFDRILNKKIIPIPGDGSILTQLGHVDDLASAMSKSLDYEHTVNQIYNCSGKQGITFLGLAKVSAIACNFDPNELKIKFFNSSSLNQKDRKLFPLRMSNFYTDIRKIQEDLNWEPKFDIYSGLKDSFINDYSNKLKVPIDFSIDNKLISD